jgi:hypothetical protein
LRMPGKSRDLRCSGWPNEPDDPPIAASLINVSGMRARLHDFGGGSAIRATAPHPKNSRRSGLNKDATLH